MCKIITGNQFVWVPVNEEQYEKMIDTKNNRGNLYEFTTFGTTLISYSPSGRREPDKLTGNESESYFTAAGINAKNSEEFKELLQKEFNQMAESIKTNKGFYCRQI